MPEELKEIVNAVLSACFMLMVILGVFLTVGYITIGIHYLIKYIAG